MNPLHIMAFLFLLNNCTINSTVDEIDLYIDNDSDEEMENNHINKDNVILHMDEVIQQDLLIYPNTGNILSTQIYIV